MLKFRDYIYIVCMIFFVALAYLLFDRGFNVKTKVLVNYQEKSDVNYKVYLKKNDDFKQNYLGMNERYITKLVDRINIDFNYNNLFSKDISGYYAYEVIGSLYAYTDDINDPIWKNTYNLLDTKTEVINHNNIKNISIQDRVIANYDKYVNDLNKFSEKYGMDLSGYFEITIKIKENLQFKGIEKIIEEDRLIVMRMPLTYDTFKITIQNDINNIDSYYDFSTRDKINYVLLIFGAFCLSLGISFLALIIKNIVIASNGRNKYDRELKKILKEHEDKIINVKRFYNKKKYNLIYVDSFKELLDVYDKVKNPINYREIKSGKEAMFIIMDNDNAWIYMLEAE